jgi:hypothetical protein
VGSGIGVGKTSAQARINAIKMSGGSQSVFENMGEFNKNLKKIKKTVIMKTLSNVSVYYTIC